LRIIALIVIAIIAFPVYHFSCPHPCSGEWFWERILEPHSFIVDEDKTHITFVWVMTDTHEFFRVSRAAVAAPSKEAIKSRIERLIGYMKYEMKQYGYVTESYDLDLKVLTGVNIGENLAAWQAWWTENRNSFVGSPTVYKELREDHIARAAEWQALWAQNKNSFDGSSATDDVLRMERMIRLARDSEWANSERCLKRTYHKVVIRRRTSLVIAIVCLVLACLLGIKQIIKKNYGRTKKGIQLSDASQNDAV